MRSLRLIEIGDPAKVLALETTDVSSLAANDLLVRMEAATINAVDVMLIDGSYSAGAQRSAIGYGTCLP